MKRIAFMTIIIALLLCSCNGSEYEFDTDKHNSEAAAYLNSSYSELSPTEYIEKEDEIFNSISAELKDEAYMSVNGEDISKYEYMRRKEIGKLNYGQSVAEIQNDASLTDEEKDQRINELQIPTDEEVIKNIIRETVMNQEIAKRGITVSDEEALAYGKEFVAAYLGQELSQEEIDYNNLLMEKQMEWFNISKDEVLIKSGRLTLSTQKLGEELAAEGITDINAYIEELIEKAKIKMY